MHLPRGREHKHRSMLFKLSNDVGYLSAHRVCWLPGRLGVALPVHLELFFLLLRCAASSRNALDFVEGFTRRLLLLLLLLLELPVLMGRGQPRLRRVEILT